MTTDNKPLPHEAQCSVYFGRPLLGGGGGGEVGGGGEAVTPWGGGGELHQHIKPANSRRQAARARNSTSSAIQRLGYGMLVVLQAHGMATGRLACLRTCQAAAVATPLEAGVADCNNTRQLQQGVSVLVLCCAVL